MSCGYRIVTGLEVTILEVDNKEVGKHKSRTGARLDCADRVIHILAVQFMENAGLANPGKKMRFNKAAGWEIDVSVDHKR